MNTLINALQPRIPTWVGKPLDIAPLSGGITNQNFKVIAGDEAFVARVCVSGVGIHGIDRQVEQRCARAAAQAGIAPEVIAFFDNLPGGDVVLITRYIDGATLQAEDVRSPERLSRIARLLRHVHGLPEFAGRFDVFRIFERCLAACRQLGAPLPTFIDQVTVELQRIETAMAATAPALVACHNDLLPANFLEDRSGRVWLLDWEYAGWGDLFFDLGNLAVNNEFQDADDEAILIAYFGVVTQSIWARLKLMKILSDAREGIWGMVQWGISPLDFDFAAYGHRHLEWFMTNCGSPEYARWVEDVKSDER